MADNIHTIIKLRRTNSNFDHQKVKDEKLEVGEPASIKIKNNAAATVSEYLVIGEGTEPGDPTVAELMRFKAFNKSIVDKQVFVKSDDANQLVKDDGTTVINPRTTANLVTTTKGTEQSTTQDDIDDLYDKEVALNTRVTELDRMDEGKPFQGGRVQKVEYRTTVKPATSTQFTVMGVIPGSTGVDDHYWYNTNIIVTDKGVLKGAAWNDFAEYREAYDVEPGDVVCEVGDGRLERSMERLAPGAAVVSDTYGMIIGKEDPRYVPIAVAGRVLVKAPFDEEFKAGDPVGAGEFGMITKMSRLETILYPDRILGYVSEIPDYEVWNDSVLVNARIWIKVK